MNLNLSTDTGGGKERRVREGRKERQKERKEQKERGEERTEEVGKEGKKKSSLIIKDTLVGIW